MRQRDRDEQNMRDLILVAEERSFTGAAKRANIAQPALSRQIANLERELGTPLFDRTSRRVAITPTGASLVQRAHRILVEVDEASQGARDVVHLLSGRLTIGMTQTPGPVDVASVLGTFYNRSPGVELVLRQELSVVVAERLRQGTADIGFVSSMAAPARQRALHALASERLVAIAPRDHRRGLFAEEHHRLPRP